MSDIEIVRVSIEEYRYQIVITDSEQGRYILGDYDNEAEAIEKMNFVIEANKTPNIITNTPSFIKVELQESIVRQSFVISEGDKASD